MPVKDGVIFSEWEGQESEEPVWSCRLSGDGGMTFSQAQNCEEQQRKILQNSFPGEFEEQLLKKIHHSFLDLEKLAQKCVKMIETSALKRGEEVFYTFKENMHQAMVTDVIFKSPKKVKSPNKENISDCVYDILLVDSNKERNGVSRKSLVRSVATPDLSMMKTFIRAHARRHPETSSTPWVVDDTFRSIYDIPAKVDLEKMKNGHSGDEMQTKKFDIFEKMKEGSKGAKKEKATKRKKDPEDSIPKKPKTTKPKKQFVQKTIADSFAKAGQKKEASDKPKEVTIPPRVIEYIQELKILDRKTDDYWSLMKKVVTPAWNQPVAFRDKCKTMMSKSVAEDFMAEFAIKRLGNKPSSTRDWQLIDQRGMRPLPEFAHITECVDSDFYWFTHNEQIEFLDVLYISNYFLNTNLVKLRPLVDGQEYSNAELQHGAFKLVHGLLKNDLGVCASFWANYLRQTSQKDRVKFRTLQVSRKLLKKPGWLAVAEWHMDLTPYQRAQKLIKCADGYIERYPDECTPEKKTFPLGVDRSGRTYWVFFFVTFILVQPNEGIGAGTGQWYVIKDVETLKRTIDRLDPRGVNEQALKEVLKEELEPVKKIFKERADFEANPPSERVSRSSSLDCNPDEIVKSQLVELTERLYQGQLSNVDEIEPLHARINTIDVTPTGDSDGLNDLRELIFEVTDSIMDKNIKNPSQLLPPHREKFYKLVEDEKICGLSVLITIVWESVAWDNFKQRKTIRSARLRARVDYSED